jgi:hypothetical protein
MTASTRSPEPVAPVAAFDDSTGAIEGIVTDAELTPIRGADVWFKDEPMTAKTDAEGRFAFSKVEPGGHLMFVQAAGYEPLQRALTVIVGEVTRADLTLVPIMFASAFHATKEERGIGGCSFAWRPAVGTTDSLGVCGLATSLDINTGFDRFIIDWKLNGPFAQWTSAVFEMAWKPNQVFGKGMEDRWEAQGCSVTNQDARLATSRGPPPHTARVIDIKARIAFNLEKGCTLFSDCKDPCGVQSRVFPTPDTLGSTAPADLGVVFQQTFTQYFTDFYTDPAPESFSALADA